MKRKTQSSRAVLLVARGGLIAALYVTLTYLSSLVGLSSGVIQFRLSEALCILPIFLPEAVFGLSVGCMLANMLTGALFWDVVFGTLATLIGAAGAYLLRRVKFKWIATLPTVLANAIIIPFVLLYVYGAEGGYFFFLLTVGAGEVACATFLGTLLAHLLEKNKIFDIL
ncbi:MAG: QueT transporter family protein [Clostridia bacterium]|nr:QueT transporter family protein [Clostridia bacterium]